MPSNGKVRPSTKMTRIVLAKGTLRCPRAKPARVDISTAAGTTPSSMRKLDCSNVPISAALNALMKFSQWGCWGHASPEGYVPGSWSAVTKRLINGMIVRSMTRMSRPRPIHSSRAEVFTILPSRAQGG